MYNPYLEEVPYEPVEELPLLPREEQTMGDLGGLADKFNLSSLKNLLKGKDSTKTGEEPKSVSPPKEESVGGGLLDTVKQKLRLEDLDAGDILLVVILIYLMIEGDDKLELAITLGVLAVMWLAEGKKEGE